MTGSNPENKNVVLVGNGPSATRYRFGSLIESFDVVCRFNNFVTVGYESFVGKRTDCWVVCDGNIKNGTQYSIKQILFCVPLVRYNDESTWLWKPTTKYTKIPKDIVESVTALVGAREGVWPSTGMFAVGHFLSLYSEISIVGFDFFGQRTHHYFPHKDKNWHHDGTAERKYIEHLVALGKVKILGQ